MMTDDFYLIRQYNRQPGAQGFGGIERNKTMGGIKQSDLHNQGSTNTRNLRRILHKCLWTWGSDCGGHGHAAPSCVFLMAVKMCRECSLSMYCCHPVEENCSIAKWCEDAWIIREEWRLVTTMKRTQRTVSFCSCMECTSCAIYVYDQVQLMCLFVIVPQLVGCRFAAHFNRVYVKYVWSSVFIFTTALNIEG